MSDNPRAIAARLNEVFRRHCGLSGYRHEANRQEDEACMQDALEEMGMLQSPVTINPALAERGDLVRKLRARVQRNHVAADKWATIPDPLCQAAADEIERLRENVAELEQLHDGPAHVR